MLREYLHATIRSNFPPPFSIKPQAVIEESLGNLTARYPPKIHEADLAQLWPVKLE